MAESSEFFLFGVPYHFCECFFTWIRKLIFSPSISGHGFDKEGYDTLIEAQYKAVTEMQPSEYQYMSAHLDCNKVRIFFCNIGCIFFCNIGCEVKSSGIQNVDDFFPKSELIQSELAQI